MPVISAIKDILHITKIILICICFFRFNKLEATNKVVKYCVVAISTVLVSLLIFYFLNPIFDFILNYIYIVAILFFLYDENRLTLSISGIWIVFLTATFDSMSLVMVENFLAIIGCYNNIFNGIMASLISLIFVIVLGKFFYDKSKIGIKNIGISKLVFFLIVSAVDSLVCYCVSEKISVNSMVFSIALCIFVVGTFIQLGFIVALFVQNGLLDEQKKIVQRYLNEQKEYYEYLIEREADTRKFRHDIKNHILIIIQMIEAGENEKLQEYLKRFTKEREDLDCKMTIFNGTADAIINRYYAKAVELGIDMKVSGKLPVDCKVDAYDICAIFSNILSNAVEASMDADEKRISLECRYTDDNTIIIYLCNTFKEINMDSNGKLLTHKKDKLNHGLGMEIVADSVKLYNGWYDTEIDGDEFKIRITLNL